MSRVDRLAMDIQKPLVREQKEIANQKLTHHEGKEGIRQGGRCVQATQHTAAQPPETMVTGRDSGFSSIWALGHMSLCPGEVALEPSMVAEIQPVSQPASPSS